MKTLRNIIILAAALLCLPLDAGAQKLHLSGTLQNMHLWRGLQVADGGVLAADASVTFFDESLKIGLWGGTDFTGDYKEFDYYLSWSMAGFSVAVWDIFNFSPDLEFSKDIFNYNKLETSHFIDVTLGYNFDTLLKVPLSLSWSTIVQGRDLNPEKSNMFSTFCYAEYSVLRNEHWKVDLGLGGVFAFNNGSGKTNFYGNDGINQVSLKVTRNFKIKEYNIPIFAHAMWNPDAKNGYLQFGVQLINF